MRLSTALGRYRSLSCLYARCVHSAAVEGFGSTNIERYERGRPKYPTEALQHIISLIAGSAATSSSSASPSCIVELGAGTGKFTQSILPHLAGLPSMSNIEYVATEPVDTMRARLASLVEGSGVRVEHGTGDRIPVENGAAVAVIAAQSFHWMANMETLREMHRVLKKGAVFVGIWNTFDYSRPVLERIEREIIDPCYEPDVPRQQTQKWKRVFTTVEAAQLFHPLQAYECMQQQVGPFDMIADRVLSISVIAKRSPAELHSIRERLRAIVDTSPDTKGQHTYTIDYRTELYSCARR